MVVNVGSLRLEKFLNILQIFVNVLDLLLFVDMGVFLARVQFKEGTSAFLSTCMGVYLTSLLLDGVISRNTVDTVCPAHGQS